MDVTVSGKQQIIGIDNIEDASDYNQYDDVPLFTDLPNRIKHIERKIDEDNFCKKRTDGFVKSVKR
uniref:Uncharacterized protein n=1 Tax=Oryza alta TaxID=52545 RepID=A0A1V1H126_9ORYZ|nr:hypothetical protein [Oryza alta]BAX25062.1 hypothetical protein [Oryza alta]